MNVLVATNNKGKVERYRKLLEGTDIELVTPAELGIEGVDVVEDGATLAENAEKKARAYFGMVDFPIIANDTGVWVDGEGMILAPKRLALGDADEKRLSLEEIAERMTAFWKGIATKYGGEVDAAFPETFACVYPDGTCRTADSKREVLLTDRQYGPIHLTLPIRPLYISKATGKAYIDNTEEDEALELKPVRDALVSLLLP